MPDKAFKLSKPTDPHWCVDRITGDSEKPIEILKEYWGITEAAAKEAVTELNQSTDE